MWVLIYVLITAWVTWKVAKLYFSMKFKYDVKFIESIVRNVEYVIQKGKPAIKKEGEEE